MYLSVCTFIACFVTCHWQYYVGISNYDTMQQYFGTYTSIMGALLEFGHGIAIQCRQCMEQLFGHYSAILYEH